MERADLIKQLTSLIDEEPAVRVAVLFGSWARDAATAQSDVDIAVLIDGDDALYTIDRFQHHASQALGIRVDLVDLARRARSAMLMAEVLRDGIVLADRDGEWSRIVETEARDIDDHAVRERATLERDVHELARRLGA